MELLSRSRSAIRARRIEALVNWGRANIDPSSLAPLGRLQFWAEVLFPDITPVTRLSYAQSALQVLRQEWGRDAARAKYVLNLLGEEEPAVE